MLLDAKIVIIEDETLFADMLERFLSQTPGLNVIGTAGNGVAGVELCLRCKPDLVLLDIEMPGQSGLEVARQLRETLPQTRIMVVSSHCEPYSVHEISRWKIEGFVQKGDSLKILLAAVREVLNGKTFYCEEFNAVMTQLRQKTESYQNILSPREIEVLMLVAEGRDDMDMAEHLGISASTAATHRRNLRVKLGAHKDRDLVNYALKCGLVSLVVGK